MERIKVYPMHRQLAGRPCWTWCHRGQHASVGVEEMMAVTGSAYGPLYSSWQAAMEAATRHAQTCQVEGA